ncbi:hypothetical protein ACP4OV_021706 [Aristida adscensionis]
MRRSSDLCWCPSPQTSASSQPRPGNKKQERSRKKERTKETLAAIGMPTFDDSFSAIIAGWPVTAHLFTVDRYWRRKKRLPNGQCVDSPSFRSGHCSWRISYYPNGARSPSQDYISIFLVLDGDVPEPVTARARFTLLDVAGEPVPLHSIYIDEMEYAGAGAGYGCDTFVSKEFLEQSPHLVDNCFRIRCDVVVSTGNDTAAAVASSSSRMRARSDLHTHLGDLLDSEEGADVTFQVAGETFGAHRCLLAARSPVFRAELAGGATAGPLCVRIDDMEAHVFKALLHFIYTDSLPGTMAQDDDDDEDGGRGEMMVMEEGLARQLLVAAGRYGMRRLKLICAEELRKHVDMDTVAGILVLAEQHGCQSLKEACIEFLEYYPEVLDAAIAIGNGFKHLTESCLRF